MGVHYRIRSAVPDDCGGILALIRQLAEEEGENPDEVVENTEKDLRADSFREDAFYRCLVVEAENDSDPQGQNGALVGYAMYFLCYSSWMGRMIYLEDLYLQAAHRGKGLGKGLVCRVAKIGAENGCKGMQWVVQNSNQAARRFYDHLNATDKTKEGWRLIGARGQEFVNLVKQSEQESHIEFL